ncbi:CDP-diacylglycerol--glycerol-3-phosphate 3-phosphatidyltransferase [Mycoplasma phocoeninasale]|uniref:CDP-diacylglycerol--glycerol-3-phosphate 3-phosphatidyltransferase n=1 Tax=Mycoplasma phocoeninasale TaxID=2726117 RepID=A0A858U7D5_9MOLU|nr:CDP-diacylglycerol--glycerol-3-phosphate 3-phosphatidyltransferase [Mycoplasma phocoeninasale]QJG66646.1 CDP-diacylglycerol--glycerol-3-phosphate 3-phosphatidyltransferase [Mycoplasma phocoeninasale]
MNKSVNSSKLEAKKIKSKFGIANWLTVTRMLIMIPFICILSASSALILSGGGPFAYSGIKIVSDNKHSLSLSIMYWLNVALFIAAMITDFVDGYYARKTNTVSAFGKVFDPIADKIATTLMMIFLAIANYSYLPIVVLFIIRDIMVDGSRVYASKKDIKVAANWWGKVKTIIVSAALIIVAFAGPWLAGEALKPNGDKNLKFYANIPLILGLIIAWISGIIYMSKYLKGIRNALNEGSHTPAKSNADDSNNKNTTSSREETAKKVESEDNKASKEINNQNTTNVQKEPKTADEIVDDPFFD